MQFLNRSWWLKVLVQGSGKRQIRQRQRVSPGCIERLESRQLLTTFMVTSTDDTTDAGTLRWAIEQANDSVGADTITFDTSFQTPRTIVLGGTQLPILDDATGPTFISGPSADLLTISGNQMSRIFEIATNQVALIDGLTISGGAVSNDEAGGAIANEGVLTISNSVISNSWAYHGGAVDSQGTFTASHVQFLGNLSDAGGGAIFSLGATNVEFCVFDGNTASLYYGDGGGIYQASYTSNKPPLSVSNSTFRNSSAARGGAISNSGLATIYGSTFHDNEGHSGGAIYNRESMVVFNSTFAHNHAHFGGAIQNYYSASIDVNNVTITDNTASESGAGIWQSFTPNFSLTNSIVAGNLREGLPDDITADFANHNIANNIFKQSSTTTTLDGFNNNIVLDPQDDLGLGPLADNGGFTQTMALLAGSPAIDHGFLGVASSFYPEFDQRGYGFRRAQGTHMDIGAIESNFPTTSVRVSENQTYVMNLVDSGLTNFPFTYAVTGGADQAAFAIYENYPSSLYFVTTPDCENPHDVDHDNVYQVQVTITNSMSQAVVQDLTITVEDANEPPVITLNPEPATYESGSAPLVDPQAVFTSEVGGTDFSNAKLFLGITENRGPNDRLTIVSEGKKPGQIQMKKGKILFGGVEVGRLEQVKNQVNTIFQVSFNSAATGAAIRAVIQRIGFSSRKNRGTQQPRTLYVGYYDDVNLHYPSATRQINVVGKG